MERIPTGLALMTWLRNLPRGWAGTLVLAGLILISGLDYVTGLDYSFSLFYYLIVAGAALVLGRWLGFGVAVVTVVLWTGVSLANGVHYHQVWGLVWAVATRLATLVLLIVLVRTLQDLALELGHLAQRDPLTHALNRRTFDELLDREIRTARRYGRPLTLAYFDVDDFKKINDRNGHAQGDRVLRSVASSIQERIRPEDVLARMGGDEFVLLLPDLGYEAAGAALGRIFDGLTAGLPGHPTLSIGALTFDHPPEDPLDLVHQVDRLLYEVKRSGKAALLHRPG